MPRKTLAERLWSRVRIGGADECWPWLRAIGKDHGYGVIGTGGSTTDLTHRVAYVLTFGPIPEAEGYHGGVVRHTCDFRPCCNPNHLIAGSQGQNLADAKARGRTAVGAMLPQAKLTDPTALALRRRYDAGEKRTVLAKEHGITTSTLWSLGTRKTWKHLKDQ